MSGPSVCVIIPSVRNAEELGIVLQGLSQQNYRGPLEIVVVGPNEDPARDVAQKSGVRFIDDGGSRTRADACNVALRETESEIVLFTDDDVIVPEDWVEKLVRWFEKEEVAGVGGPNFAPIEESTLWQRIIDVAFCSTIFTAGTNYGKLGTADLEEVTQLPGVNSGYRREVLEEVGGFDEGAIGAEDVMLDHRISTAGYKLWTDKTAVMWHRRRNLSRVKKQIRNYGLVRTLASHQYAELHTFTHSMVATFPPLVMAAFAFFFWGLANGGMIWPEFWNFPEMGWPRAGVHTLPPLMLLYNLLAWYGSAKGNSPSKTSLTIFLSSIVTFTLHWNYGMGVIQGKWRILTGNSGLQIDDRNRE
ncbi:MAG: glycosyltransferase [Candidatus Thalassarchaeaceae archaeon]|nr:glycosyltransferase [Candidatus Thalassarchaeaceae archaeon]DAC35074.1 MAG TPA: glycosyltransferase [Candidatus Poseidoniales archaeon]HJM29578.1 glycosyltransferase [Candidatus Thalassarchaeaceae archaeon]